MTLQNIEEIKEKNICLDMPLGYGKSTVLREFLKQEIMKDASVSILWVSSNKAIIKQTYDELRGQNLDFYHYKLHKEIIRE